MGRKGMLRGILLNAFASLSGVIGERCRVIPELREGRQQKPLQNIDSQWFPSEVELELA